MRKFGDELQRQLDENNMKVKKGVMQDATFLAIARLISLAGPRPKPGETRKVLGLKKRR